MKNITFDESYNDYGNSDMDELDDFEDQSLVLWKLFNKSKTPIKHENKWDEDYAEYSEGNDYDDSDDYDQWIE